MKYIWILFLLFLSSFCFGKDKEYNRGLVAKYYKDIDNWGGNWPDNQSKPSVDPKLWTFGEYRYSRVEPLINHQFINNGWFSIRWEGYLSTFVGNNEENGKSKYIFEIFADDGCRLIIDGKMVIDSWNATSEDSFEALRSGEIELSDGMHKIVIEYFQGQSLKKNDRDPMKLYWRCDGKKLERQIIPAAYFWN